MAYIVMAYTRPCKEHRKRNDDDGMAYIVMAYVVMAHIVMAYVVMAYRKRRSIGNEMMMMVSVMRTITMTMTIIAAILT